MSPANYGSYLAPVPVCLLLILLLTPTLFLTLAFFLYTLLPRPLDCSPGTYCSTPGFDSLLSSSFTPVSPPVLLHPDCSPGDEPWHHYRPCHSSSTAKAANLRLSGLQSRKLLAVKSKLEGVKSENQRIS